MTGVAEEDVQARLTAIKRKAWHPSLALWNFVADSDVLPDVDEISDEDIPEEERENAELRRAAIIVAAKDIVDWCIDDIEMILFDDDGQADEESAEETLVYSFSRSARRSRR